MRVAVVSEGSFFQTAIKYTHSFQAASEVKLPVHACTQGTNCVLTHFTSQPRHVSRSV